MEKQRIAILGGGESGVGAAMLAQKQGFDVFLSDFGKIPTQYKEQLQELNIAFEENMHSQAEILKSVEVIKSPGIPDTASIIKEIKAKQIPIVSEIEFAKRYTNAKTICITGSNGKTTTTMLTYHILKNAGLNVGLAGNIGHSFAAQVATSDFDWYVLEISSFMLDDMYDFKADIAVLLNITPDHLDRYDYKLGNYAASKMRIAQNQTSDDVFIYCADDEETLKVLKDTKLKSKLYPFSIINNFEQVSYI
jgi:UDP-N-acetylmuramoylalanine--D-glutamate ligase